MMLRFFLFTFLFFGFPLCGMELELKKLAEERLNEGSAIRPETPRGKKRGSDGRTKRQRGNRVHPIYALTKKDSRRIFVRPTIERQETKKEDIRWREEIDENHSEEDGSEEDENLGKKIEGSNLSNEQKFTKDKLRRQKLEAASKRLIEKRYGSESRRAIRGMSLRQISCEDDD